MPSRSYSGNPAPRDLNIYKVGVSTDSVTLQNTVGAQNIDATTNPENAGAKQIFVGSPVQLIPRNQASSNQNSGIGILQPNNLPAFIKALPNGTGNLAANIGGFLAAGGMSNTSGINKSEFGFVPLGETGQITLIKGGADINLACDPAFDTVLPTQQQGLGWDFENNRITYGETGGAATSGSMQGNPITANLAAFQSITNASIAFSAGNGSQDINYELQNINLTGITSFGGATNSLKSKIQSASTTAGAPVTVAIATASGTAQLSMTNTNTGAYTGVSFLYTLETSTGAVVGTDITGTPYLNAQSGTLVQGSTGTNVIPNANLINFNTNGECPTENGGLQVAPVGNIKF